MDEAETSYDVIRELSKIPLLKQLLAAVEQDDPTVDDTTLTVRIVPSLVNLLHKDEPSVQYYVAQGLTNIAADSSLAVSAIVSHGAVEPLIRLLSSQDTLVVEQALWTLGNIVGDCPEHRDTVLNFGIMLPLLQLLSYEELDLPIKKVAVWVLLNLCRQKPVAPSYEMVSPCFPVLAKLIYLQNVDVLVDTCWTVLFLCDGAGDTIQRVIEAGLCERLAELLQHPEKTVITPVLRTIGCIMSGNEEQAQTMFNCSILPLIRNFLSSGDDELVRDSCWVLSNITAGNDVQVQAVIDSNIFPMLLDIILNTASFGIRVEATWTVLNATAGGTQQQISYLVSIDCIKSLCDVLFAVEEPRIIQLTLEGLEHILKIGGRECSVKNPYATLVENANSLDRIVFLQSHEMESISRIACRIIEKYFTDAPEEMVEDQSLLEGGQLVIDSKLTELSIKDSH